MAIQDRSITYALRLKRRRVTTPKTAPPIWARWAMPPALACVVSVLKLTNCVKPLAMTDPLSINSSGTFGALVGVLNHIIRWLRFRLWVFQNC
jgi:hypothetical protein